MSTSPILDNYAKQVHTGLKIDPKSPIFPHLALGLTGESGEVADIIKKSQYLNPKPFSFDHLEEELGDVLWYLQGFCNVIGITLEELAIKNIKKLAKRRPNDYTLIPTP